MSTYDGGYDDGPRRYYTTRTRVRDRDDPDYVREEVYVERGKGGGPRGTELAHRTREREDSIEEIPRDFPPGGRGDRRRARSTGGRTFEDDYYEDESYTRYNGPASGVARRRGDGDRRRRGDRGYESDGSSQSPPPRDRDRRKSGVGETLESLGLGGIAGALLGAKKDKDKARSRSGSRGARSVRSARSRSRGPGSRRDYSSDDDKRSRSRADKRKDTERKWAQSAQAALIAGAVEAFRVRKEPGGWGGEKGKRIATAALASGAIDGFIDRDPNKKQGIHLVEAVIGGLAANRLANGPRSKSRGARDREVSPNGSFRSRSRSIVDRFRGRSQSRGRSVDDRDRNGGGGGGGGSSGAVKGLVAGGALAAGAAGAKAIYDRVRSKSRKRRSPSNSSADSYVPSRNRRRDRRRSPPSGTDGPQTGGPTDRSLARGTNRDVGAARGAGAGAGAAEEGSKDGDGKDKDSKDKGGNDSSSSSTSAMERKRKKMRGKELITAGLATVATIHAAHSVYNSMQGHEKRHRLVAEGEMSVEEARKKQTKAWIQDAAAVGIAALGIKGAFSEWKEMKEQRDEVHELERNKRERRRKRLAKARQEQKERQDRMLEIMEKNPQFAMGYNLQQMERQGIPLAMPTPYGGQAPPAADLSGNPYASR